MDWNALLQLGGLGVVAVLMIVKDTKRDNFLQAYMQRMQETIDKNTDAFRALKETIERKDKK